VSYDVFFQGFIAGESSHDGSREMSAVLQPYLTERKGTFRRVKYGDGEAELDLERDNMTVNHVTGSDPWDLLVKGAQAANWVILPLDCPICLTGPGQREELPEELGDDIVYVDSGAELLAILDSH
jgi:hypothetical protein